MIPSIVSLLIISSGGGATPGCSGTVKVRRCGFSSLPLRANIFRKFIQLVYNLSQDVNVPFSLIGMSLRRNTIRKWMWCPCCIEFLCAPRRFLLYNLSLSNRALLRSSRYRHISYSHTPLLLTTILNTHADVQIRGYLLKMFYFLIRI